MNFLQTYITGGIGFDAFIGIMNDILDIVLSSSIYTLALGTFTPIGVMLCAVYFCVEMSQRATTISFNVEVFIRQMIRFLIAYILVSNLDSLFTGFNDFVTAINDDLISNLSGSERFAEYINNNNSIIAAGSGLRKGTGVLVPGLVTVITSLMNLMTSLLITIIAVDRAIKIGIKTILAPLVVPDIYNNGLNSSGIKFLRGLFADFFQTTVVILVLDMCTIVAFNTNSDYNSELFLGITMLFNGFICLKILAGSLRQTSDYANAIMSASVR